MQRFALSTMKIEWMEIDRNEVPVWELFQWLWNGMVWEMCYGTASSVAPFLPMLQGIYYKVKKKSSAI